MEKRQICIEMDGLDLNLLCIALGKLQIEGSYRRYEGKINTLFNSFVEQTPMYFKTGMLPAIDFNFSL